MGSQRPLAPLRRLLAADLLWRHQPRWWICQLLLPKLLLLPREIGEFSMDSEGYRKWHRQAHYIMRFFRACVLVSISYTYLMNISSAQQNLFPYSLTTYCSISNSTITILLSLFIKTVLFEQICQLYTFMIIVPSVFVFGWPWEWRMWSIWSTSWQMMILPHLLVWSGRKLLPSL